MTTESIHPDTAIGAVYLTIADLGRSLAYYQQRIGLRLHRREGNTAHLGVGGPDLLVLQEQPGARPVQPRATGLYHFAILVPSRLELARTLQHLAETQTPIGGFSDHAVSEAIYLSDPDGHGIEIYRDRPRAEWRYDNSRLHMTTEPLDLESILGELAGHEQAWSGMAAATTIGHIHLHVAQLIEAERFYTERLGFDLVLRYGPSAGFVSAGGYHHHIGMNTWAGVGVPPPPADAARLLWYEIRLPDEAALAETVERVKAAGVPISQRGDGYFLQDPAQNGIMLTT